MKNQNLKKELDHFLDQRANSFDYLLKCCKNPKLLQEDLSKTTPTLKDICKSGRILFLEIF